MTQKPISVAEDGLTGHIPIRVVMLTLDSHLSAACARAERSLKKRIPGLRLDLYSAAEWDRTPAALRHCRDAVAEADILFVSMLFLEDQITAILPALQARRDACDAVVSILAESSVIELTRLGRFEMGGEPTGAMALLRRLRGAKKPGSSSGAGQMKTLKRLPKILRFVPGTAQDVRSYFLTMQYWLAGSADNIENLVAMLINKYAAGARAGLKGSLKVAPPRDFPDIGLYHPDLPEALTTRPETIPGKAEAGTIGLLVMRSYLLAGDTAHYDAAIRSLEAKGFRVLTAFASGLDCRPAIDAFFKGANGQPRIDALLSLTGFSLVGGPAYNDADAARQALKALDMPYIAAHALEFQTLDDFEQDGRGLMPIEATMMVAIPELDGATGPTVFGGRQRETGPAMMPAAERVEMLANRVAKLVALRRKPKSKRRVAAVLFNFPPGSGAVGTAAFLSVWASLFNTLKALRDEGYRVDLPADADALRQAVLGGNAADFGTDANVAHRIHRDDHIRTLPWLEEIEAAWGPAPGKQLTNGRDLFVMGAHFGNVFVGIQPGFGYEGDPMRLLFEKGLAPTHAFAAFYQYLRHDLGADAVLHLGTHGALEFMPGHQVGMGARCWPDRMIGDLPNFYVYAANNPSEGSIAKRRSAATLISYTTPSVTEAGLHKQLTSLKEALQQWRRCDPTALSERKKSALIAEISGLAEKMDLWPAKTDGIAAHEAEALIEGLHSRVREFEQTLIPEGLHTLGEAMGRDGRLATLKACAAMHGANDNDLGDAVIEGLVDGQLDAEELAADARLGALQTLNDHLMQDSEIPAILRALDGRYIEPAPGGDLLTTPEALPTGRNLHGFDPFRLPSRYALRDGEVQADRLLERFQGEHGRLPRSLAFVLWGTDNLKSEGAPIGQVMALVGARPRLDSYGRICGAALIPLSELERARVDCMLTLSGIFRDLLPLQVKMLAEAFWLAARAEGEAADQNPVRASALKLMQATGCTLDQAALRVFSNAQGAYGSHVGQMIDAGSWQDEAELAASFQRRKCFAYGLDGLPSEQPDLMQSLLTDVEMTYQNLDSVELGVTTIDQYVDTLGGISRAVKDARGESVPVYIGDHTGAKGKVRTLAEQVTLETHTRTLNPRWYEGLLNHGFEGVRHIEAAVTNTMGWSATTETVAPWIYEAISETFVLDDAMRHRLAELNPKASAKMIGRLIEASERTYWTPDAATLDALMDASDELEDAIEGVSDTQITTESSGEKALSGAGANG